MLIAYPNSMAMPTGFLKRQKRTGFPKRNPVRFFYLGSLGRMMLCFCFFSSISISRLYCIGVRAV